MAKEEKRFSYEGNGARYVVHSRGIALFYRNNILHRSNGPAIMWPDCSADYYLDGKRQTKEEHERKNKGIQI